LLALSILVLAGSLVFVVGKNFRKDTPGEILETITPNVDLSLQKLDYTETRDGVRRWSLQADSAAHNLAEGVARLDDVTLTFYDSRGGGDVTLTGDSGELKTEAREVEVSGKVVIRSSRGYVLYTDHLHYRDAEHMVKTDASVRMVAPGFEVTGTGLQLNVESHALVLLSRVEARLEPEGLGNNGK
jgi:LPS export ABC transporter protein LptC